jgi:hypothetical protein
MIRILVILTLFSNSSAGQEFVKGWIVTQQGDTVFGSIVKHKKKYDEASRKYAEVQFRDSTGNLAVYYPPDLKAYYKNGELFQSINTRDVKVFGLIVTEGNVRLMKTYSPLVQGCKYFFRRKNEPHYSAIDCALKVKVEEGTNNEAMRQVSAYQGIAIFRILTSEASYRDFFMDYFKDRPMIVKKLRTGFITSSDTEEMFKEYNSPERK